MGVLAAGSEYSLHEYHDRRRPTEEETGGEEVFKIQNRNFGHSRVPSGIHGLRNRETERGDNFISGTSRRGHLRSIRLHILTRGQSEVANYYHQGDTITSEGPFFPACQIKRLALSFRRGYVPALSESAVPFY